MTPVLSYGSEMWAIIKTQGFCKTVLQGMSELEEDKNSKGQEIIVR
jgi:hypothetical protein